MKKCISASSALLVTAMTVTLSFGCGEGIEGDTGSQSAQLTNGQCNAIVARSLGLSQQCNQFGCSADQCAELAATFNEFFDPDIDCAAALFAGELNGLGGSALRGPDGKPKHIEEVICGAAEACDPTCPGVQSVGLCLDTEACP